MCSLCEAGKYASEAGSGWCMTCPSGEYPLVDGGATACVLLERCYQGGLPCTFGGCTFSKTSNGTLQRSGQCPDQTGWLDLNDKGIAALSPGVFDDIGGIWSLYLSDNELTSLPSGIFDSLTALEYLSLDNNKLEGLSADLFAGLPLISFGLFCSDETNGDGQSCGADDNPAITCAPFTAGQFNGVSMSYYRYSGPSERCCADKGDAYATDGASCVCSPVRAGGSGLVSHGALTPAPCPPAPACACLLIQMHAFIYIPRCVCLYGCMCLCESVMYVRMCVLLSYDFSVCVSVYTFISPFSISVHARTERRLQDSGLG